MLADMEGQTIAKNTSFSDLQKYVDFPGKLKPDEQIGSFQPLARAPESSASPQSLHAS